MSLVEARRIVGNQPKRAVRNMVRALSLHPWLNTPDEALRLTAATIIIQHER